jgi:glycosyltransferase involved in cell wall biosynthesis/SAM-dependent methyltransferase
MPENRKFTATCFVPATEADIDTEYMLRYLHACECVSGKEVLDIANGEGYGAAILSEKAAKVICIDKSPAAVARYAQRYPHDNLEYRLDNCANIPLPDESVDVVVGFKSIDHHLDSHRKTMLEIKRVLRPNGVLFMSTLTAGKHNLRDEQSQYELNSLLSRHFNNIRFFRQRLFHGSSLSQQLISTPTLALPPQLSNEMAIPWICAESSWLVLASDGDLPQLTARHAEHSSIQPGNSWIWRAAMAARDDRIECLKQQTDRLKQKLEKRDNEITRLQETIVEIFNSTSWKISTPLRILRIATRKETMVDAWRNAFTYLKSRPQETPWRALKASRMQGAMVRGRNAHGVHENPKPQTMPQTEVPQGMAVLQGLQCWGNIEGIDPHQGTILLVSHEASRTGSPILSLNLVQAFKKKYNVVALLLGPGVLLDDFKRNADMVIGPIDNRYDESAVSSAIEKMLDSIDISFAIVNSIESRNVLPGLSRRFVPTLALIHEFATYTRPREAFIQAAFWASTVIFPEEIVRSNVISECPELAGHASVILPQGRCSLHGIEANTVSHAEEREAIARSFRPEHGQADAVVILGAGTVHLRKGVDLFLDCAARIANSNLNGTCRFVWVGGDFDPENDAGYSVYLEDQIQRSGLGEQIAFLGEVTEMEYVYELADILLLSSRLDPLPNVAIDAMFHGIPVLCMDKTTGIAELLKKQGLTEECVAPYRDIEALTTKLSRLIESKDYRNTVGKKLQQIAQTLFDMDTYVSTLEKLGIEAIRQTLQEREDCQQIASSGLFRPDFCPPDRAKNTQRVESVREYVRAWASMVGRREPYPGFHPGVYLDRCGKEVLGDPFADYLRSGMTSGPWLSEVIVPVMLDCAANPEKPIID